MARTEGKQLKPGRCLLRVLVFTLAAIVLLLAVLSGIQFFATRYERATHPAPGTMVTVNGKQMHVYVAGEGETTYVLLSGGGIGVPVIEYRPLWSRFAEYGTIAVVEYPGYGWSEDADTPRTAEAVVEEIRAALAGANLNPPYVLVAHSIGGIYAMSYAAQYPDELEAIISLDTTLPRALAEAKARGMSAEEAIPQPGSATLLRKTGILRALLWFDPLLICGAPEGVYSEAEAREMAMVTSWNYAGRALIHEYESLPDNMTRLSDFSFPTDLPVLMIQANPTGEATSAAVWLLTERQRLVAELDHGKAMEMRAGHCDLYWLFSEEVVRETLSF